LRLRHPLIPQSQSHCRALPQAAVPALQPVALVLRQEVAVVLQPEKPALLPVPAVPVPQPEVEVLLPVAAEAVLQPGELALLLAVVDPRLVGVVEQPPLEAAYPPQAFVHATAWQQAPRQYIALPTVSRT